MGVHRVRLLWIGLGYHLVSLVVFYLLIGDDVRELESFNKTLVFLVVAIFMDLLILSYIEAGIDVYVLTIAQHLIGGFMFWVVAVCVGYIDAETAFNVPAAIAIYIFFITPVLRFLDEKNNGPAFVNYFGHSWYANERYISALCLLVLVVGYSGLWVIFRRR